MLPEMSVGTVASKVIGHVSAVQGSVTKEEEEQVAPLLAVVTTEFNLATAPSSDNEPKPRVHLVEDKLDVQLGENKEGDTARWILDSGATNHMTGSFRICRAQHGSSQHCQVWRWLHRRHRRARHMLFTCKNGEHWKLCGVYHIPRLMANIVSLGQLDQDGYKILIEEGILTIWDHRRRALVRVN